MDAAQESVSFSCLVFFFPFFLLFLILKLQLFLYSCSSSCRETLLHLYWVEHNHSVSVMKRGVALGCLWGVSVATWAQSRTVVQVQEVRSRDVMVTRKVQAVWWGKVLVSTIELMLWPIQDRRIHVELQFLIPSQIQYNSPIQIECMIHNKVKRVEII